MLAKRIIPTLLVNGAGALVKGKRFASDRVIGDPVQAAHVFAMVREVDELVLLDVDATREGRCIPIGLVQQIADCCFIPLSVGGGITTADRAMDILRNGADKIILGTAAFRRPSLIEEITQKAGCQAVVVSVDVRQYPACPPEVVVGCGREQTQIEPAAYARHVTGFGAGEILLQSVNRDGEECGYDLEQIAAVSKSVGVPVIASGGAGAYADLLSALNAGADAVAAGAMWQFSDQTPRRAKAYLAEAGIPVRL